MSKIITVNVEGLSGTREEIAHELHRLADDVVNGKAYASTAPNKTGGSCQVTIGMNDAWFPSCRACDARYGARSGGT
jgi:hypothetical protein